MQNKIRMGCGLPSVRVGLLKGERVSAGNDADKRGPCTLLVGIYIERATVDTKGEFLIINK